MALTDGLHWLWQMSGTTAVENNVAPSPLVPLTISDPSGAFPDADAGPVPPANGAFRSFATDDKIFQSPGGQRIIAPGAGPVDATIYAWIRLDNLNGADLGAPEKVILMEGNGGAATTRHFVFHFDGGGNDRAHIDVNQTNQTTVTAESVTFGSLAINTWYMVVAVLDGTGGTVGMSVNNSTLDTVAWDGSMFNSGGTQSAIAHFNNFNSGELEGDISDLAVWNRALSAAEIGQLWNGGAGVDLTSISAGGGAPVRSTRLRRRLRR